MDLQEIIAKGKKKLMALGIKQWAMLLLAGVCCLVIVFPMGGKENDITGENERGYPMEETYGENTVSQETNYEAKLEARLEELLSEVKHVGKVKVMITVSATGQKCILQDGSLDTEQLTETDNAGGTRYSFSEKSDKTTVFYDIDGESVPYILSETYPEVTGVVVLAEGSGTGSVDLEILNAVQVLFDVPAHKIRIMKMK